jgi:hypothetical protein
MARPGRWATPNASAAMTDLPMHAPAIVKALDKVEAMSPKIVDENPDEADFWPVFACYAEEIEAAAPVEDCEYLHGRISCMLKNVG